MTGEHLWLGNIGKFLLLLSFFLALFSGVVYTVGLRFKQEEELLRFNKAGKISFIIHAIALIGACIVLGVLIFNHYFEYAYVWKYSSLQMPLRYTIACFWAGQEGSFLLWGFWQVVMGLVVLFAVRKLDSRVMAIIAFAQAILLTAILGVNLGFVTLGTSPFALLRELPESVGNAFFQNPNYLADIKDGIGLNPLLENFWMISHPPVLFLGYASTLIPFALAFASLWKGDYTTWLSSGIKFSLWAMLTLAVGIIIGGAWAYKSLTFGGFWAWDPVENASLVPLLLQIGGLHFLIIALKRNYTFGWAYGFILFSYIFVWYASFLTRSGVLGQTSVHAFGSDGMTFHLAAITIFFLLIGIIVLIRHYKNFPKKAGAENVMSKDFIMLVGSLILALSAFQITMTTSIPIWNKLLGLHIAPPLDPVKFYNSWQIPYTAIVLLLIACIQYANYYKNKKKEIEQQLWGAFVVSLVITIAVAVFTSYHQPLILLLFFATVLAISVSLTSLLKYKGMPVFKSSVVSHVGFAIFILGALLAFSNSRVISNEPAPNGQASPSDRQEGSAILFRNQLLKLGDYYAVYDGRSVKGTETFYQIDFYKDSLRKQKLFTLYPTIKQNEKMGAVFNPSTQNFVEKDIYTYISHAELLSADLKEGGKNGVNVQQASEPESINLLEYKQIGRQNIAIGQSLSFGTYQVTLDSLWLRVQDKAYKDVDIMAKLNVVNPKLISTKVVATFLKRGERYTFRDAIINQWGIALRFEMTSDQPKNIQLGVYERKEDFIVLKAIVFPWMNVLWLGVVIMLFGFGLSLYRRLNPSRD